MRPPLDVPSAPPSSSTYSRTMACFRIAILSEAVVGPGRLTPRLAPAAARRRSAQRLISGFGNPVTATPPWSQRATLAWPEFEVLVATRFEW
jgi:hypothetical protein